MTNEPVYLDYQATTPVDPRVRNVMLPWFDEMFGNPHSSDHAYGWVAEQAVEDARGHIAKLIGAKPSEITFTSGATEANNLAVKGTVRAISSDRNHVVTCATEHKCVLESCARLEREGFTVTYLPVEKSGLLDLDLLENALSERTALVSIMMANNEIGVIQPVTEIASLCARVGALFHTDAAQAVAKIPIDVNVMGIDLLSISAHKLYGPMGIGALYVRQKPKIKIEPLLDGGGQERGLRSGTVPAPLAIGFGEACRLGSENISEEADRITHLRDQFLAQIFDSLDDVKLNGDLEKRIPGNLNLSFPDIDAQDLMMRLPGIALSSGSACTTSSVASSHVLQSIGVEKRLLHNAIRIGFGRFTVEKEVIVAAEEIIQAVLSLRNVTQTYEKNNDGQNSISQC